MPGIGFAQKEKPMRYAQFYAQVSAALLGLVAGPAAAAPPATPIELPLALAWCEPMPDSAGKLVTPNEVADDTLEAKAKVWGVDGFVSAIFDEERLIAVRFRAYQTAKSEAAVKAALEKQLGAGASRGSGLNWAPGEDQTVQMKLQSEQIYVNYEIPFDACSTMGPHDGSLSEQEKKDLEAVSKKNAVDFDPYTAKDPGAETLVEKRVEAAKKADEEKREEQEKKDADVKDSDVDW
jgi:hypothetical protein